MNAKETIKAEQQRIAIELATRKADKLISPSEEQVYGAWIKALDFALIQIARGQ